MEELKQLKKENRELDNQISILMDLNNLKDESFYRKQILVMMNRMIIAIEKVGY